MSRKQLSKTGIGTKYKTHFSHLFTRKDLATLGDAKPHVENQWFQHPRQTYSWERTKATRLLSSVGILFQRQLGIQISVSCESIACCLT